MTCLASKTCKVVMLSKQRATTNPATTIAAAPDTWQHRKPVSLCRCCGVDSKQSNALDSNPYPKTVW